MLPCNRVIDFFLPRSCLSGAGVSALTARAKPDFSCSFKKHCSSLEVSCCRQLNRLVETFHDDLTPRFGLRHSSSRQQEFGGTLARKTQLAQSIRRYDERFVYSLIIFKNVMQPFKLMNWCCGQDANFNIAVQGVNNLLLHVVYA